MGKNLDLPELPSVRKKTGHIAPESLTRKKLQALLHIITADLKKRGTKTPHVFLPFRSRVDDAKLEAFLGKIFPGGVMIDTADGPRLKAALREFDEFTLICALKYLWCRLPNSEVIGWDVYLEFQRREREAGYPRDAFLSIMPKCLSSSSHASIVYDFLDLLISVASNSQYNYLSGRKISKMASMWAFNSLNNSNSPFYDATAFQENSFLDGLEAWRKTPIGLFHLLLAFLRAMLPDTEAETLNLPKTLQSLLITNSYPPSENSDSVKSVITIPCVQVKSTKPCRDPYELISKVRHTLKFDKKDSFLSIENYTILKNIFQKDSTNEIISTLTEESRRILSRLTKEPIRSQYDLYPGWTNETPPPNPDIPLYSEVSISNVTLQDYYIWTWLSSLASDQTGNSKALFGRSIVVEAGLRGFQKWLILTETTIHQEEYLAKFDVPPRRGPIPQDLPIVKDLPAPPQPNDLLPQVDFGNESLADLEPSSDYKDYLRSLEDDRLAHDMKKLRVDNRHGNRPKPPPLEHKEDRPRKHKPKPVAVPSEQPEFHDPYENYATQFDRNQPEGWQEPFDNYQVPVKTKKKDKLPPPPAEYSAYSPQPDHPSPQPFDDHRAKFEGSYEPAQSTQYYQNKHHESSKHYMNQPETQPLQPSPNPQDYEKPRKSKHKKKAVDPYAQYEPAEPKHDTHEQAYNSYPPNPETQYPDSHDLPPLPVSEKQPEPYTSQAPYSSSQPLPDPPYEDSLPLPSHPMDVPDPDRKARKKKHKRRSKHREDLGGFSVDQLPDGPPPPLPLEPTSNGASQPTYDSQPSQPVYDSQPSQPVYESQPMAADPSGASGASEAAQERKKERKARKERLQPLQIPPPQNSHLAVNNAHGRSPSPQMPASSSHSHHSNPASHHSGHSRSPYHAHAAPPPVLSPGAPPAQIQATSVPHSPAVHPPATTIPPASGPHSAPLPNAAPAPVPRPNGHARPPQPMNGAPMMPPQGYYYPPMPPAGGGYYPPAPQMPMAPPQPYGYPPQAGPYAPPNAYAPQPMYYPPPQGYYPPPQAQGAPKPKPTASELAMSGIPQIGVKHKKAPQNKASLRAAFNQNGFGI